MIALVVVAGWVVSGFGAGFLFWRAVIEPVMRRLEADRQESFWAGFKAGRDSAARLDLVPKRPSNLTEAK